MGTREGNHERTGSLGPGERVQERQSSRLTESQPQGGMVDGQSHRSQELSESTFPELGSVRAAVESFVMDSFTP